MPEKGVKEYKFNEDELKVKFIMDLGQEEPCGAPPPMEVCVQLLRLDSRKYSVKYSYRHPDSKQDFISPLCIRHFLEFRNDEHLRMYHDCTFETIV